MSRDDLELVRGSGNVFRDFGDPNVEPEQTRALFAAKIIRVLDDRKLSVRAAKEAAGVYTATTRRASRLRRGVAEWAFVQQALAQFPWA
jgi:hypothetical protein